MLPVDWTKLSEVLTWVAGGGGSAYIVAYMLSLIIENVPAWHNLPSIVKFISPMIASVLLAVGATLLLQKADIVIQIAPWWGTSVVAVIAYLGSQKAYMDAKTSGYAVNARMKAVDKKETSSEVK